MLSRTPTLFAAVALAATAAGCVGATADRHDAAAPKPSSAKPKIDYMETRWMKVAEARSSAIASPASSQPVLHYSGGVGGIGDRKSVV